MRKHHSAIKVLTALFFAASTVGCANDAPAEHEHIWDGGEVTTPATCHSEGETTFKCTVPNCQQTKTTPISMLPHNWDEGKITTAATCEQTGVKTFTCLNEGCGKTKTVDLPKTDHHFEEGDYSVVPDLLESGARNLICTVCGETSAEEAPAHADFTEQFGEGSAWFLGSYATLDGSETDLEEPTPLVYNAEEAAFKSEGIILEDDHVSLNNKAVVIGYNFASDVKKVEVNVEAAFRVDTDSTSPKAYVFQVNAGHVKKAIEIDTTEANWDFKTEETLPLEKGDIVGVALASATESKGGFSLTITAKCPHVYHTETQAATCTAEGKTTYTCILCEETYEETIAKVPHKYGEGTVTKKPTKDAEGEMTYTCAVCGDKKVETMEPNVHEDCLDLTDKLENRFNDGVIGNSWLTDYDHAAHFEITKAHESKIYEGGGFINTGVELKAGKTYHVTFDVSAVQDKPFELILQYKQWADTDERLAFIDSVGSKDIFLSITEETKGSLWFALQFGTQVNEIVVGAIKAEEVEDEHPDCLDLTDKVLPRFDDGAEGEAWSYFFGHEAHFKVTKAHESKIYEGGGFIDTGVELKKGEKYKATFEIETKEEKPFSVLLQNAQWHEVIIDSVNTVGSKSVEFEIHETNKGSLWFGVQFGTQVNEVVVKNIKVEKVAEDEDAEFLDLSDGKVIPRFEGDAEGNVWHSNYAHAAHFQVTKVTADNNQGGGFINTGIALEKGKKYTVNFKIALAKEEPFELHLQNARWDEVELFKTVDATTTEATFEIAGVAVGELWFRVASGQHLNEITISNIKVTKVADDENGQYLDLSGKDMIRPRFDAPAGGSVSYSDYGHTANFTVETIASEIHQAGGFIDTGFELVKGKKYEVKFTVSVDDSEGAFKVRLQNKQWDATNIGSFDAVGTHTKQFEVTNANAGTLWFGIQSGTHTNVIHVSNILVKELTEEADTHPEDLDIKAVYDRKTVPVQVTASLTDYAHTATFAIADADGDKYHAGGFVETGVEMVKGKKYRATFTVSAEVAGNYFEVYLQNKQYSPGDVAYADPLVKPSGEQAVEFEVTEANKGELWLMVLATQDNTITISKIQITQIAEDQNASALDVSNKLAGRFDGTEGGIWTTNYGHDAHVKVSTPHAYDMWRGGGFIDTGIQLEQNKKYTVTFHIDAPENTPFTLFLSDKHFDGQRFFTANSTGDKTAEFEFTGGDDLWLCFAIECGTTSNEIVVSNIRVTIEN